MSIVASAPSLAVPRELPVRSLSVSSIRRWLRCQEDWRRHYIEGEPDQVRAAMLAGRAFGAATQAVYWARIRGGAALSAADADDLLAWEFETELTEARVQGTLAAGEEPADALEGARAPLRGYLRDVAPKASEPRAIERELRARFPAAEWSLVGYLDVDCPEAVLDLKLSGSNKWSQRTADADLQAGIYLLLRRLCGDPAERFEFHLARPGSEEIRVIETRRNRAQLAHLEGLVALVARQIAGARASGDFGYAAEGAWWCSERWCAHFARCPAGGAYAGSGNPTKEET